MLDSIAVLIRKEPFSDSERENTLFHIATLFKTLADAFNLSVIVTNQPSPPHFNSNNNSVNTDTYLGHAWFHCVNMRLVLNFHNNMAAQGHDEEQNPPSSRYE